ncbi:hypothetical protein ADICEAN_02273 [Cesiribacter andamanensis AMV16]|uniref:Uncharacterized protein n=1 Tax=Cesiribacter andamanensis AMV16 TaxID=1279009 RepID=M7N5K1_9BACT|nr:hypothetical protein ADICEAN_02273 [Cesiribacter andamanensis AMV16]
MLAFNGDHLIALQRQAGGGGIYHIFNLAIADQDGTIPDHLPVAQVGGAVHQGNGALLPGGGGRCLGQAG